MKKQYHIVITDREDGVIRDVETDAFCMLVDEGERIAETIGTNCGASTLADLTEASKDLTKTLKKETAKAFLEMLLNEDDEEQSE